MAEPAARLVVELSARTTAFQRELASATSAVKMRTTEIVGALDKVRGVAGAVFGGAIVASLSGMVTKTVEAFDGFNDLADATGASVENISALDRIARETGGSFEGVSTTLIKFNELLGQTQDKGGKASGIFKAIGLDAAELRKMDPAEALLKTAVALEGYADNGDKARFVQDAFRDSVKVAVPLLKDLAEKGRLVGTVTKEQAEEADKYAKAVARMKANAEDVTRVIGTGMLPVLNEMMKAMDGANFGEGVTRFFKGVVLSGSEVAYVFQRIGLEAGATMAQIGAVARGDFSGFAEIARAARADAEKLRSDSIAFQVRMSQAGMKMSADAVLPASSLGLSLPQEGAKDGRKGLVWSGAESAGKASKQSASQKLAEQGQKLAESLAAQESGLSGDVMEKLHQLSEAYRAEKIQIDQLTMARETLIAQQPFMKAAADEATKAALAKSAAYEREIAETGRALEALSDSNIAARQEVELIGLTEQAQRAVARAREDHTIALKEEQLARLSSFDLETRGAEQLVREIQLLKERRDINDGRSRAVLGEQEKKDAADWAKGVGDDLKGAFQLAFNSAENPLRAFGKSLASTVYQRLSASAAEALAKAAMQAAGSSGGGIFGNIIGAVFKGWLGSGSVGNAGYGDYSSAGLKSAYGWSGGGWTGPGGVHEPAGVVHKGEVVWSQADISKAGGVAVVEAMRLGRRGYADGGIVGITQTSGRSGGRPFNVIINNNSGAQVEAREQQNANGGVDLVLTVARAVESHLASGMANRSGPLYRASSNIFMPRGAR